ncbi:MAG TPA: NAD(P)-dependent oxidoreductase [Solirubrobacteraceae bacterium]|nr:NAD(P)-dependent oxidoreductase [Solirubrobacteraceae bacterium]
MSRVLVTGATGFIGRHALTPLLEAGHEVHAISTRPAAAQAPRGVAWHVADLLADQRSVVAEVQPERLLHLAWYAEHGRFWTAIENVEWVEASLALLRAFAAAGGERAVLAGTCAEYDWEVGGGVLREDAPLRPATLYGAAKAGLHQVAAAFAAETGLELAWGRVFFLYGPGEDERRLVGSVASALARGEHAMTGAGAQIRDLLHVADVGAAFAALVDSDVCGAVNVGSGEGRRLREVIEALGAISGRPELLEIGALPARPGDPDRLVADVARLREEVGFVPRIGLERGLEETVAWWRERG